MWKHAGHNRRYRLAWRYMRQCWCVVPEIVCGQQGSTLTANQKSAGSVALAAAQPMTFAAGGNGHLQIAVEASEAQTMANKGRLIRADGGQMIPTAQDADVLVSAVVSNTGAIQASTVAEREGTILLLADFDSGTTQVAGTLDSPSSRQQTMRTKGQYNHRDSRL